MFASETRLAGMFIKFLGMLQMSCMSKGRLSVLENLPKKYGRFSNFSFTAPSKFFIMTRNGEVASH